MTEKRKIRRSDLADLERAISRRYPSLPRGAVRAIRSKLMRYISSGLDEGYDVALMKTLSDEEIRLRILRLLEE